MYWWHTSTPFVAPISDLKKVVRQVFEGEFSEGYVGKIRNKKYGWRCKPSIPNKLYN